MSTHFFPDLHDFKRGDTKPPFPENTQVYSPLTVSLLKLIHRDNILSPY